MAFTSDIVLNDAQATPVAHTFTEIERALNTTKRVDANAGETLTEPQLMEIKHSVSGKAPNIIDRHLVSFSETVKDSLGVSQVVVCNFTLAVPRSSVITRAKVNDQFRYLINLLSNTTYVDKLLRGES